MADHDLIVLRRHSFCQPTPPKFEVGETRPRRSSTAAICRRPDRAVDFDLALDNFPTPTVGVATENSQGSLNSRPSFSPKPQALTVPVPFNLRSRRLHRSVVISNLPPSLDIRDVFCRIRGGPLANCFLSIGPGMSVREEHFAVLTFENSRDAAYYTNFIQTSSEHAIWAFQSEEKNDVNYVARVQYHTNLAGLRVRFETDPIDIPLAPSVTMPGATRCLLFKSCPLVMIECVFKSLRILPLLQLPYFRSQMEDIWINDLAPDSHGRNAFGDLHIWFTNINAAIAAMRSVVYCSSFSANLRFEPDPCAQDVSTLQVVRPFGKHSTYRWHSYANMSLLTFFDHGVLESIFQDWRHLSPGDNLPPAGNSNDGSSICNEFAGPGSGIGIPDHEQATGSVSVEQQLPDCSRTNWVAKSCPSLPHVSWSCDMTEFMAMTDQQWMAFGTAFYVPPPGFNTAKRHANEWVQY